MRGEQNPGSNSEIDAFIDGLRGKQKEVLDQVQTFLRKPNKTGDEVALGIYLDTVLKSEVYGVNPFVKPGDQEAQEERNFIAFIATEYVAEKWLLAHADSEAAKEIAERSIFASSEAQRTLLHEVWESFLPKPCVELGDE